MGHLKGNRFRIRLRLGEPPAAASPAPPLPLAPAELTDAARALFAELSRRGVPNFYGPQRFGRGSRNPALGRCLVLGAEAAFCEGLKVAGISPNRARDRRFRNLMVNAFQAELFNRVLARRLDRFGTLLSGDLAWLHRNGAVFKVVDPAQEQPRCDAFEISPSGPLFGPKMPLPEGVNARRLQAMIAPSKDAEGMSPANQGRVVYAPQPFMRKPKDGEPGYADWLAQSLNWPLPAPAPCTPTATWSDTWVMASMTPPLSGRPMSASQWKTPWTLQRNPPISSC